MASEKFQQETGVLAQDKSNEVATNDGNIQSLDARAIRKLRWKIDMIILPTLAIMYTFNSLDRSNLGNAATAGLKKDTHLTGDQYNLLLTIYYVMFVLFGPVMTVFTKICSAKISLPCMMVAFGIASACTAVAKNLGHLMVCRIFVGIFESGFLASVVFYLSKWYTRSEIASRIAIFYAGAVVASAFGGLIAFGMFHIKSSGNLFDWSYLFILEGCLTCLVAIISYFVLPRDIANAWFLTQSEKEVAEARIQLESMQNRSGKWVWSEAISEFKTVHGWARVVIAFSVGILPNASANFLAIMTVRLGYSVTKTNLVSAFLLTESLAFPNFGRRILTRGNRKYTVAPAMTAAVFLLIFAYSSDYFRERGFHMTVPLVLSLVGYAILLGADIEKQKGTGYLAIFFCTIGAYPMSVIFSAWTVANIPNLNARAFTTGVLLACLNSMGLVASNIFFAREAPRYKTALIVNMAFPCAGIVFTVTYSLYLRFLNRKLEKEHHTSEGLGAVDGGAPFRYQT
ncbi:hypothetical protein LTS17_004652 [Exophiala oligosperma]